MNITATQYCDLLRFSRESKTVVRPLLQVEERHLHVTPIGIIPSPVTVKLWRNDGKGGLVVRAGMLPRIESALRQQGHELFVKDRSTWRGQFDRAAWDSRIRRPWETSLIGAIEQNPRGRIVYEGSETKLRILANLGDIFPEAKIFAVVKNHRDIITMARRLPEYAHRPITMDHRTACSRNNRFYVGGISAYHSIATQEAFDIIVFADRQSALARASQRQAWFLRSQRMYVLEPYDAQLDDQTRLLLQFLYGSQIVSVVPPGRHPQAVQIELATPPSVPITEISDPLERKRRLYWHNAERNQMIAQIAQACHTRDVAALWNWGLFLVQPDTLLHDRFPDGPIVAIVVESAEHAHALARLLPDWQTYTAEPKAHADAKYHWHADRAIITQVWAHLHHLHAHVVVRADGTATRWHDHWGPSIDCWHSPDNPLLVIDIRDDQDRKALEDSHRRGTDYRRRGWDVPALLRNS